MKTTKEQRSELREMAGDAVRRANMDGRIHQAGGGDCCPRDFCRDCGGRWHQQGTALGMMRLCEKCPRDASKWVTVNLADLLADFDEMERERDEWKRSAETVATERDHAIRRLQDASDIGKRHAMAEANESANLRVASVIRELRDEIAEKDTAGEKLAQTIACSASAARTTASPSRRS